MDPDSSPHATQATALVNGVFRASNIKGKQPKQAFWLSCRGDCIYGVEWAEGEKPSIQIKTYDPAYCYPNLDPEDPGGMLDLLITYEVPSSWIKRMFGLSLPDSKKTARLFIYWDQEMRSCQVEKFKLPLYTTYHDLGFVPWRWASGNPNGHLAQGDIAETPKLQQLMCDTLMLALNAARKRVDKAFWGSGITGDVVPRAGHVNVFPNPQAKIEEYPSADPPEMLMGVMQMIQQLATQMAGVSPISMEGVVAGSNITGASVRHQVEAIEARQAVKQVSLESAYSMAGEYVLRILEKKFPNDELVVATTTGAVKMSGADVREWYLCDASYGGWESMSLLERGRWAMEGLGRIHDDRKAVEIVYQDMDPDVMVARVHDYQLRQAAMTGESQAAAQQAAQGGSGSAQQGQGAGSPMGGGQGAPPGSAPTPPLMQRPQPPGLNAVVGAAGPDQRVHLNELESLINLVRDQLRGNVYAVGQLALQGAALDPVVAVESEHDQPLVETALSSKNVPVIVGIPDGPKVSLLT
jgi:hypothetical protein